VELVLNCGTLDVQAGTVSSTLQGWALDARHRGAPPTITMGPTELVVRAAESGARRQEWTLFLPQPQVQALDLTVNAGSANADVSGGVLESLALVANASDVRVNAAEASIADLDVRLNAGRVRLTLGGETRGVIRVNAGTVDVCTPPTTALRIETGDDFAFATNLADRGLTRDGDVWTRVGSDGSSIDLAIEGNASAFSLDPAGGC
jgi:hypothetical protein